MAEGISCRVSKLRFDDSVARVKDLLAQKGAKLFCEIDHSGEARAVGLEMPRTKLLIFGSAKAGTPLMVQTPSVALDLPLKLLIAETGAGEVLLSWNEPQWLQRRHGFSKELESHLAAAQAIADLLASM